ncbi:MAG: hypothetical protein ACO36I_22975 [Candidatus Latescibacterota bacterium]
MNVVSRLTHIFMIIAMVFATNAACFCWMQMSMDAGCHASEKMQDCCCNQETQVDDQIPARDVAVLPPVLQMLDVDLVVSEIDDASFFVPQKFLAFAGVEHASLLHAPPDLYVLHATFLI